MGAPVIRLEEGRAGLTIPLRSNINHEGTVFGGSLNALGLLTAAASALNRLRREGYEVGAGPGGGGVSEPGGRVHPPSSRFGIFADQHNNG